LEHGPLEQNSQKENALKKRKNAPEIPPGKILKNTRKVIIEEPSGSKTAYKFSDPGEAMEFARRIAGWPRLELLQVRLRR
jgi:hypothetical protein